jgi:hypothetical protein
LRRPHLCNYCRKVNGVSFDRPPKVRARILWLKCWCGRRHYACVPCVYEIGVTTVNGEPRLTRCARDIKVTKTPEVKA